MPRRIVSRVVTSPSCPVFLHARHISSRLLPLSWFTRQHCCGGVEPHLCLSRSGFSRDLERSHQGASESVDESLESEDVRLVESVLYILLPRAFVMSVTALKSASTDGQSDVALEIDAVRRECFQ